MSFILNKTLKKTNILRILGYFIFIFFLISCGTIKNPETEIKSTNCVHVERLDGNYLYSDEKNELLVLVTNTDPNNIKIDLTNAELISFQNGICIITPSSLENVVMEVRLKNENVILIKKEFRVINRS